MSWWMYAMSLRAVVDQAGGWEWVTSAPHRFGVPDEPPATGTSPTVLQVLEALRGSGCQAQPWFSVEGLDVAGFLSYDNDGDLARLAERGRPHDAGPHYLGELTMQGGDAPLPQDATVDDLGFRKPVPAAVLHAMCALAALGTAWLVFAGDLDTVVVVSPGDTPEMLAGVWPW